MKMVYGIIIYMLGLVLSVIVSPMCHFYVLDYNYYGLSASIN